MQAATCSRGAGAAVASPSKYSTSTSTGSCCRPWASAGPLQGQWQQGRAQQGGRDRRAGGQRLFGAGRGRRAGASLIARAKAETAPKIDLLTDDFGIPNDGLQNVFTFERWKLHRLTSSRYQRHMMGILNSRAYKNLSPVLVGLTSVSVFIGIYEELLARQMLPYWCTSVNLSDGPFELTSFALSLLLVFRTDSSYGRWNEAMEVWTTVRGVCKDIVRATCCWVKDPALLALVVRWTLAYTRGLKVYLREKSLLNPDIDTEMSGLLLPHERARLRSFDSAQSSTYPHYALHVLTQAVERLALPGGREDKLLLSIQALNRAVGTCEKLLRYPIPLSYTRHTSRFLISWLGLLPFAIWDDAGWLTPFIVALVSYLLLGIEEIGVQIEEPFASLPLEDFVRDIEKDLGSIIGSRADVDSLIKTSMNLDANVKLSQAVVTKLKPRKGLKGKGLASGSYDGGAYAAEEGAAASAEPLPNLKKPLKEPIPHD